MQRRDFIGGATALSLVATSTAGAGQAGRTGGTSGAGSGAAPQDDAPFTSGTVRDLARALAGKPYQAPDDKLPDPFAKLTYDQYRAVRFDPNRALWRGTNLPFQVQFFHRGLFYKDRVDIYVVADGRARPFRYSPDLFQFGDLPRPASDLDLGFSGFRLHAPINRPDYFDEVCVFQGASYFRAVAKGQGYGLSARGLAIRVADQGGEEFPLFRAFWLETPQPGVPAMVVHALLDSPSAAAAYRFTIRPGEETLFDTEAVLFPRADIDQAGLGPGTSMFWFGPNSRAGIDDFRPAVHDSDGLLMLTGRGEQVWRPLSNPTTLQVSGFGDTNPRGFGLMQRARDFAAFDDLEARYERRPSLWVEPIGNWNDGTVTLVEIPTHQEIHDNIVAFWRPKDKLQAKGEYGLTYRLHWCRDAPWRSDLARVTATRSGAGGQPNWRRFVIEMGGDRLRALPADAKPRADVSADQGKIENVVAQPNPETGGWRVSFELDPGGAKVAELRALLATDAGPLSETWLFRWTK